MAENNDKYMIRGVQFHADYLYGQKRWADALKGTMHQGWSAEQKSQLGPKFPLLPETKRAHWDHMAFEERGGVLTKVYPTGTSEPVPEDLKGPDGIYHYTAGQKRKIFTMHEMASLGLDEKPASPEAA
jgi:hypothetical protein